MKKFGFILLTLLGLSMLWLGYGGIQSAIRLGQQGAISPNGIGSMYVYLEIMIGAVAAGYGIGGLIKDWDRKIGIVISVVVLLVELFFSGLIMPIGLALLTAVILLVSYKFNSK